MAEKKPKPQGGGGGGGKYNSCLPCVLLEAKEENGLFVCLRYETPS